MALSPEARASPSISEDSISPTCSKPDAESDFRQRRWFQRHLLPSSAADEARQAEEGPEPGTDLEYQVNVPFWTAIRGGVMRLNITRHDVCAHCHGQGALESPGKCPECDGTGQITQTADA